MFVIFWTLGKSPNFLPYYENGDNNRCAIEHMYHGELKDQVK